jgi:hypothetical protein
VRTRTVWGGAAAVQRSGLSGANILASNAPYSRLVDCETLRTVDASSPFITPRPLPVAAATPGNSGLTVNARGAYHYPWKTEAAWAGTCRELVLTRRDGKQHRAFLRFAGWETIRGGAPGRGAPPQSPPSPGRFERPPSSAMSRLKKSAIVQSSTTRSFRENVGSWRRW